MSDNAGFTMFGLSPDELWKIWLTEGDAGFAKIAPFWAKVMGRIEHSILKAIPSDPRCVSCYAPFQGAGAPLMRAIGRERSLYNPSLCEDCENLAKRFGAKAEVPLTMLFADIRGSTKLAEEMSSDAFSALINKFYTRSSNILIESNALIDKFIGDEISAYWVPGLAGKDHAAIAFESAKNILKDTENVIGGEPWVPIGIGIDSGVGVVGAIGQADGLTKITVLGDTANTAARLASQAKPGEILFSDNVAVNGGVNTSDLAAGQSLQQKGKKNEVKAWSYYHSKNHKVS